MYRLFLLGVLSVCLGGLMLKMPHLQLAMQLESGALDGRHVPVSQFVPARFEGKTVTLQLGALRFAVPERATIEALSSDDPFKMFVTFGHAKCWVFSPRNEGDDDWPAPHGLGDRPDEDELDREIATCAASRQDLSFRMSAPEVQLLQERLEIRPVFLWGAERAEAVRSETLSGLLLIRDSEGEMRVVFTYFSPDGVKGRMFALIESRAAEDMEAVRALVSSFSLSPEASAILARSDAEP